MWRELPDAGLGGQGGDLSVTVSQFALTDQRAIARQTGRVRRALDAIGCSTAHLELEDVERLDARDDVTVFVGAARWHVRRAVAGVVGTRRRAIVARLARPNPKFCHTCGCGDSHVMSDGPGTAVPGPSARRLSLQVAKPRRELRVTEHDVLVGFRLRLFTQTDELDNVSAACRAMGVDGSTYYRLESASIAGAWRRPTFVASLCSFSKSRSSFAISR